MVVLLQVGRGEVLLLQNMSSSVARHVLQILKAVEILILLFWSTMIVQRAGMRFEKTLVSITAVMIT